MESPKKKSKLHNKSGTDKLQILSYTSEEILEYASEIIFKSKPKSGLMGETCLLFSALDGRFTLAGKKVFFGYHAIAFGKFGRDNISLVAPAKTRMDLVISHLCGTQCCVNSSHLILEPKWVNDERTHCHFCIGNILKTSGYDGLEKAFTLGICPHLYPCCKETLVPVKWDGKNKISL